MSGEGTEVRNGNGLLQRLRKKQTTDRDMDRARERLQLLQGGLNLTGLPRVQFPELRRQIFLRYPGAPARPTQKLGIDGDADHGRSPAGLARATFGTWTHNLAVR